MTTAMGVVLRNARRAPLRGALTVLAVAVCLVAVLLIRIVIASWTEQVRVTPDDRVLTRHSLGWGGSLPVRYAQRIREFAGVRHAMGGRWGELTATLDRRVELDTVAVEAARFIAMHHELRAAEDSKRAFVAERRGAFVSAELAAEFGWQLGDLVHLRSVALGRDIPLVVSAIFESARKGFARRALYYHWEYLNELLPAHDRNRINIVAAEIEDPRQGASIANAIDRSFLQEEIQTFSQEDRANSAQQIAEFAAFFSALELVGGMILAVIALLLGNTIGMAVRERRREYATLRALGFLGRHVVAWVLAEAALLGFAGGLLGLLLSVLFIEHTASRYLEEALGLPPLELSFVAGGASLAAAALLGALAALPPALGVGREALAGALRRVA